MQPIFSVLVLAFFVFSSSLMADSEQEKKGAKPAVTLEMKHNPELNQPFDVSEEEKLSEEEKK